LILVAIHRLTTVSFIAEIQMKLGSNGGLGPYERQYYTAHRSWEYVGVKGWTHEREEQKVN